MLALALASASTLSMFWNTGREAPSWLPPESFPPHPDLLMDRAIRPLSEGQKLEERDLSHITERLALAPLTAEPFIIAGARPLTSGSFDEAETLLQIAVRRDPRSKEARVLLLDIYAAKGNARGAVSQIEALYNLMPSRRPLLRDALVYLASLPSTRSEALDAIALDPLKRDVVRGLARSGASASMLLDTLEAFAPFDTGDQHEFVASIATPLLRAGDWEGARRIWSEFNPRALTNGELIVDPLFTGEFGPPFGWQVHSRPYGYARFDRDGLTGEFYGRRAGVLVSQTIVLEPGRYRASIAVEAPAGGLELVVKCNQGADLVSARLTGRRQDLEFDVDSECVALDLAVTGKPSDPPSLTAFRIIQINVERLQP